VAAGKKIRKSLMHLLTILTAYVSTRKDIISVELEECQKLLKYAMDAAVKKAKEKEIAELKMALDLLP
jgi:hypothetical protein